LSQGRDKGGKYTQILRSVDSIGVATSAVEAGDTGVAAASPSKNFLGKIG